MKSSMKRISAVCILALAPAAAMGNIIPTLQDIVPNGSAYTWTYNLQLASDQSAVAGPAPTANPVGPTISDAGAFQTLYDFYGYVTGTCSGPAGWTCTAQNLGFEPADVLPNDDPGIPNITWARTSGGDISGQPNGVDLGLFTVDSIYHLIDLVSYTGRALKNSGPSEGTFADNVGKTAGPINPLLVSEPGSLALMALGMGLAGVIRRKSKKAA